MFGWVRKLGGRIVYETPRQEPGLAGVCEHGVGMLDACRVCDTTQRLAELRSRQNAALRLVDQKIAEASTVAECDALLEVRLMLRPSVPVIPGRTS